VSGIEGEDETPLVDVGGRRRRPRRVVGHLLVPVVVFLEGDIGDRIAGDVGALFE